MASDDPLIGKQIGNFLILAKINSGSFGSVYQGKHVIFEDDPIVAIKLLHTALRSSQEHTEFIKEAQVLKKLNHPHILRILDAGFQDNIPYMVTEYAEGGSLRDLLKQSNGKLLPLDKATNILDQIGQALHYAHERHIIHRDLKPENILFNQAGEALLADFGIAILLESSRTGPVGVSGTPPYMAPEQFEGLASARSDQYSLGCIAYELVTGHRLFSIPNAILEAYWYHHAKVEPTAPTKLNPRLPIYIEHAILKALAKKRTDRHENISAFLATLDKEISPETNISKLPQSTHTMSFDNLRVSAVPDRPSEEFKQNRGRRYAANRPINAAQVMGSQLRLDPAQLTDVGRTRDHNEDNMAYVTPKDPQVMAIKGALFIVADGIGGHAAGEVASEIAVDTVSNAYYHDDSDDVTTSLVQAIRRANAAIHQRAAENMLRSGMGTTCVAAVLRGNMAYIANVGDSRAYLSRNGQVKQVSQDHSWVYEQVRAGLLTEDQARTHAQRNGITRSLGTQAEVDVDVFVEAIQPGDYLVLCTNGLHNLVSDEELSHIVEEFSPQESIYHLVERANENGGNDNVTVQVVKILEIGPEPDFRR